MTQRTLNDQLPPPRIEDYATYEKINSSDITPDISVITVVKNDPEGLQKTIRSVAQQNVLNFEYIIVDASSDDSARRVIRELCTTAIVISENDQGIADGFNKGIAASSSNIISILNAGDTFYNNALNKIIEEFSNYPDLEIICGQSLIIEKDGSRCLRKSDHKRLPWHMTVMHPSTFIKRKVYERLGLYRLNFKYAMDYELLLRCYINQTNILSTNKTYTAMPSDGVSVLNWRSAIEECEKARRINKANTILTKYYHKYIIFYNSVYFACRKLGLVKLVKLHRYLFSRLSQPLP